MNLDAQARDDFIEQIYAGALETTPWQTFLPHLLQLMDAYSVSLVLRPPADGDRGLILNCRRDDANSPTVGLADPEDWEATRYREQFFALDPFVNLPPGQVVSQQELIPDEELRQSDYYRDYLQPAGVFHILGVDTVEPDGTLARLRIGRGPQEQPFSDAHKHFVSGWLQHLRRAIQIHARINRTATERDVYAGAVEQLSMASVILDSQGRLHSCNTIAENLLRQNEGVSINNGQLQLNDPGANRQLATLIRAAVSAGLGGEAGFAHALRVPRQSPKADLGLVIRPVPASTGSTGKTGPCVVVFISNPDQQDIASQQLLAELFQLTPAEANLSIKLARGLSLAELSQEQHISQHTARAQLKSVFAKTGVTRQAELVRLILKSVASLGQDWKPSNQRQ